MADRILQAFRNNRELQCFVLPEVQTTRKRLGEGSYGSVEELKAKGLVCAGKRLHKALVEQGNAGVEKIVSSFLEECKMMAGIRHPHIVQFLGLCYLEGSALPVLVMERLDRSLDDLLETSPGLPLPLKLSLLTDVARGLLYLHTHNPPIVHRDLSARNVLLTSSLVAKISDLGNARIVNLQPGQLARTLTRVPGAQLYMPPESFDQRSRYGPRLDIFSFGHLALFTLTQKFPDTLLPPTYPDPDNPGHLLARSEVERRTDYIQLIHEQLGKQHLLSQLVSQCLHNIPAERPSAEELLQQLETVRPQIEEAYGSQHVNVEIAKLQVTMMSVLRTKDAKAAESDRQQRTLREDRARLQTEVAAKDTQLQQKDRQLQERDNQIRRLKTELQQRAEVLNEYRHQQERLRYELKELEKKLVEKDNLLQAAQDRQVQLRLQTYEKDQIIQNLQGEKEALRQQVQQTHQSKFWEVPRNEVSLNMQKFLGTGAWGFVVEGTFRGQRVAVKCLHDMIRAPRFVELMRKEIGIMAQVRHPNLVLLIAAVIDKERDPLIVTELLDISLRRAYENNRLQGSSKLSIFRDIASALNYLHLHQCGEIIHRDVSSANVLLEAKPNSQWKAKLSDFGSAKLAIEAKTTAPGAPVYSAPEVRKEMGIRQTAKLDVYSYGILLCEVAVEQFPSEESLPSMIQAVQYRWSFLYGLITSCIQDHPDKRPAMSYVLGEFHKLRP